MTDVLEIWENDPLGGCGCGCTPTRMSQTQAQRIVSEINERNEVVKRLRAAHSQLTVVRDVVSSRRTHSDYPDHMRELLDMGAGMPLFFFNKKLLHSGTFPSYEDLHEIIEKATVSSKTVD